MGIEIECSNELPEQFNILRDYLEKPAGSYAARDPKKREAALAAFQWIEQEYQKALRSSSAGSLWRIEGDEWVETPTPLSTRVGIMSLIIGVETDGKR